MPGVTLGPFFDAAYADHREQAPAIAFRAHRGACGAVGAPAEHGHGHAWTVRAAAADAVVTHWAPGRVEHFLGWPLRPGLFHQRGDLGLTVTGRLLSNCVTRVLATTESVAARPAPQECSVPPGDRVAELFTSPARGHRHPQRS